MCNTTLTNTPLLTYSDIPESERTTTICPIDRQPFQQNEMVLRINYCKHYFREVI